MSKEKNQKWNPAPYPSCNFIEWVYQLFWSQVWQPRKKPRTK